MHHSDSRKQCEGICSLTSAGSVSASESSDDKSFDPDADTDSDLRGVANSRFARIKLMHTGRRRPVVRVSTNLLDNRGQTTDHRQTPRPEPGVLYYERCVFCCDAKTFGKFPLLPGEDQGEVMKERTRSVTSASLACRATGETRNHLIPLTLAVSRRERGSRSSSLAGRLSALWSVHCGRSKSSPSLKCTRQRRTDHHPQTGSSDSKGQSPLSVSLFSVAGQVFP